MEKTTISLSLPKEVVEKVKKLSETEYCSVSRMHLTLLLEALKARGLK